MARPASRDGQIFSADLVANALRDSGYKNTAYALSELIDNSIQARATEVEVICVEDFELVEERTRRRLQSIAVVDDGEGMNDEELRASLMFGNGTRLNDRSGIGRFGMGLPNASFSQGRRVEVWSWQNGSTNALWTYIDLDEILKDRLTRVPEPKHKALPREWRKRISLGLSETGTLIIWTKLDHERLTWKSAKATLQNTDSLIGRIYRRFISEDKVTIRLKAIERDGEVTFDTKARVNDPLYLTSPSSTPAPFDTKPMFQEWGKETFEVKRNGKEYQVVVTLSYAKPETVPPHGDRGGSEYGKHAAKNIGVSLVRADREISLDPNWAIGYDPRERWWGCEVEFPPQLDEVFGVTINKQAATLWAQFAQLEWEALSEEGERTDVAVIQRLNEERDPRGVLLAIAEYIRKQLNGIRHAIQDQTKGRRASERHDKPTAADIGTKKIRERAEEHETEEDKETFGEEEKKQLEQDLVDDKDYSKDVAKEIVETVWRRELRLVYLVADLDGYSFFKVEQKPGGIAEIIINRLHPFYKQLYSILAPESEDGNQERTVEDRLEEATQALQLMFAAWARYEQESSERERRMLDDVRQDWGRMARFFLETDES